MADRIEVIHSSTLDMVSNALMVRRRIHRKVLPYTLRLLLLTLTPSKAGADARQTIAKFFSSDPPRSYPEDFVKRALTSEERSDPFVLCATSRYPDECLARMILGRFNLTLRQVQSLLELHRLKSTSLKNLVSSRPLTVVLAGATLIATTIPKEAFEAVGQPAIYGAFRLIVAVLALYLLIAFAVPLIGYWLIVRQSLVHHRSCEELLQYAVCLATFSEGTTRQDADDKLSNESTAISLSAENVG
jgi:hypothetical protein